MVKDTVTDTRFWIRLGLQGDLGLGLGLGLGMMGIRLGLQGDLAVAICIHVMELVVYFLNNLIRAGVRPSVWALAGVWAED